MTHATGARAISPDGRGDLPSVPREAPFWTLTPRQLGDLDLILGGAYAPLRGFMTGAEAAACVCARRLDDGQPFPVPILLHVGAPCAAAAAAARSLTLRDHEGVVLAAVDVRDVWEFEGAAVVGGSITAVELPRHFDAVRLRFAADSVRRDLERRGWRGAVAVPIRGVMHRAEYRAAVGALDAVDGGLVVMALSDPAEDPVDRAVRVRCLEAVLGEEQLRDRALLWLVPLPKRSVVEDAQLSTQIARNVGCTTVVITDPLSANAEQMVSSFCDELGLRVAYAPAGRDFERRMLAAGERLPDWYTFSDVAVRLATRNPPRHQRGFTVFLTGLSGSGKSTIANRLRARLIERTGRPVTLLDGDVVRQHLSSELGFSREHRDLNIRRIAFVASEITRHGGIAICAPIAPYDAGRKDARRQIEAAGDFVLVFLDAPLELCEARDRKGLYAKARAGQIPEFTGVSAPYEPPADAEVVVRTGEESEASGVDRVLEYLEQRGYLRAEGQ